MDDQTNQIPKESLIPEGVAEQIRVYENLLTPKELATRLAVPLSWIYGMSRLAKENGWPVIRCGKYTRYNLNAVLEFLKK